MSEKLPFEGFPSLLQVSVAQWKLTATDVAFYGSSHMWCARGFAQNPHIGMLTETTGVE